MIKRTIEQDQEILDRFLKGERMLYPEVRLMIEKGLTSSIRFFKGEDIITHEIKQRTIEAIFDEIGFYKKESGINPVKFFFFRANSIIYPVLNP
jgi:hypothetical protein